MDMVILMLQWREEAKNKLIKERLRDGEIDVGKIKSFKEIHDNHGQRFS